MPMLTIHLPDPSLTLDLPRLSRELQEATGIAAQRLHLMVQPYAPGRYYQFEGNGAPLVHIAVRRHNGTETIHRLMRAAAAAVARQAQVPETDVSVYVHPIEDGFLLTGGNIL